MRLTQRWSENAPGFLKSFKIRVHFWTLRNTETMGKDDLFHRLWLFLFHDLSFYIFLTVYFHINHTHRGDSLNKWRKTETTCKDDLFHRIRLFSQSFFPPILDIELTDHRNQSDWSLCLSYSFVNFTQFRLHFRSNSWGCSCIFRPFCVLVHGYLKAL
jgi:hypothetical protein